MLKLMLKPRFLNQKSTTSVLCSFFSALDENSWSEAAELVQDIVDNKDILAEKSFKTIFHSIMKAFSVKRIIECYMIRVEGNIASESFEKNTNMWVLGCL